MARLTFNGSIFQNDETQAVPVLQQPEGVRGRVRLPSHELDGLLAPRVPVVDVIKLFFVVTDEEV